MTKTRWTVNDLGYFEAPGLSVLVFHDIYPEGKQGGLGIIQHGERVATNGDLRLEPTPDQWAPLPKVGKREADAKTATIKVSLSYSDYDFDYMARVQADGDSLRIYVDLDRPLPPELVGKVSFNLELFPQAYFGKTFHMGSTFGVFPRQANGPIMPGPEGQPIPVPLATAARLYIALEDPMRRMIIEQIRGGEMALFDGRDTAQNGWFVVRSVVPSGATKGAIEWLITPHSIPGWRRKPVISISQVGYHPDQAKRAIIELDRQTEELGEGVLLRVDPEQGVRKVFSAPLKKWGRFLRFEYAIFDFTDVREAGMYMIQYESQSTPPFRISRGVFKSGVWQPTLETYFPVQMRHMKVVDRYRVWHGACHLDDALQAPPSHVHFDGYRQGAETETPYSADQHIPHLGKGGWHDAGDYDLAAGSQAQTTYVLALTHEAFGVDSDQTTVHKDERLVLLHTPDGVPDIVQQIAHGTENLLSGYRAAGHSFSGIISRAVDQYVHLGDGSTMTDNRVYDPSLAPNEVRGDRSGKLDDRWAFTNRDASLEYKVVTVLAAASRALGGYEDALAQECIDTAIKTWDYEQSHPPVEHRSSYVPRQPKIQQILAAVELLITTGDDRYRQRLIDLLPTIVDNITQVGWAVVRVLPLVNDAKFTRSVEDALKKHRAELKEELAKNPYRVHYRPRVWGIAWDILRFAMQQYFLVKAYPELFDREDILSVLNYILGCHPGSNISLVSGVGARSLTITYGINRADWSYIPGAVASGTNLVRPDFPELKDNFPFLWQQAENVIGGAATYIFCVLAADDLLESK
jgi:hypothetical protein